jgi:hypothetical protein
MACEREEVSFMLVEATVRAYRSALALQSFAPYYPHPSESSSARSLLRPACSDLPHMGPERDAPELADSPCSSGSADLALWDQFR